jgi:hypothetical protein
MAEIIAAILALLPTVLKYAGVNTNLDNLIVTLGTALTGLITSIVNKQPVESTVLTTLELTLTALEADTSLDPVILADLSEGVSVLKAGITGWKSADVNTDPSTLTPLPTL